MYVKNYSEEVKTKLFTFPKKDQEDAAKIAQEIGDYWPPKERNAQLEKNLAMGLCIHGLDPACCPCGCGDL